MKAYRPIRCAKLGVRLTTAKRKGNTMVSSGLFVGFKRHLYVKGECVRCEQAQPKKKERAA